MTEILVGRTADFEGDTRRVIAVNGREVVVFCNGDRFYAVENKCPHMGGPVGEGILMGKVEAVLDDAGNLLGERFSEEEIHLICPWHGWEWDVETGEFAGDRRRRLRRYEIAQRGEDLYVITR